MVGAFVIGAALLPNAVSSSASAARSKVPVSIKRLEGASRTVDVEQWVSSRVRIRNSTSKRLKNVRVSLKVPSGVRATRTSVKLSSLKPRASRTVTFKTKVASSIDEPRTLVFSARAKKRTVSVSQRLIPRPQPALKPAADKVMLGGRIVQFASDRTKGDDAKFAQAIAVRDGKIAYVGNNAQAKRYIDSGTEVVQLAGKMVLPGIGDGHFHGVGHTQCHLNYEGGTLDDVLGKIKACLQRADESPYLDSDTVLTVSYFMGEAMLPVGTTLGRAELDRLSKTAAEDAFGTGTTRPIVVRNMDGHKYSTNSAAIEFAGITADTDPGTGGYIGISDGEPDGQFADFSPASGFGDPLPPVADAAYNNRHENIKFANSLGITQMMRASGTEADLAVAKRLVDDGKMTVHYSQAISGRIIRNASEGTVDGFVDTLEGMRATYGTKHTDPSSPGEMLLNTVKVFCDGVAEYPGQTAAMERPYRVNVGTAQNPRWIAGDKRGEEPSCDDSKLGFKKLDENKWNIHVHAIGDRAVRVALDNFESNLVSNPDWDRRHAITHLQFMNADDVPRLGELGVIASMSLQWAQRDGWTVEGAEGYHAKSVVDGMYPTRGLVNGGADIAAGSDWPVTDLVPWLWIENAVTREGEKNAKKGIHSGILGPQHRISLTEALKASTIGVSRQLAIDDRTGSLTPGKLADLVVIDRDLYKIHPSKISETKALATMVNGQVVYQDESNKLFD
ncbi:amidohydrolase family protein [Aeromicrobium sp. P5_D10]